ncbi:tRNA 5-hydroxyuridine methyltransferase [subsurface metagenome]
MKNYSSPAKIIIAFFVSFLAISSALPQQYGDPFKGIENSKVLPMLRHLPRKYGGMNVPASDGRLLYDLIIKNGYRRGLEIGTSNGYSGLWLGLAFQQTGGTLITIEIEKKRAEEARENFNDAGLDKVIDSRINDAFSEIPEIEGDFDFVFIDAWKPDYIDFFKLLRSRIKPGGAITAHNVSDLGSQMQDFLNAIREDSGLETKIIKSSNSGVSISIVKK